MESGAIVRVYCADGPCQGEQYLNLDTGRILFDDNPGPPHHIYRIEHNDATTLRYPTSYFDHTE
jgi:hypothetical protein